MYFDSKSDRVKEIQEIPQSDVGALCPEVLATEIGVLLCYIVADKDPNWAGVWDPAMPASTQGDKIAAIRFTRPYAHYFGPPNDEAFSGHPLYRKGLRPYSAFEIGNSTWISQLEKMNSVHPRHNKEMFADYRHYIFSFHDSIFECIAEGFEVQHTTGSIYETMLEVLKKRWS